MQGQMEPAEWHRREEWIGPAVGGPSFAIGLGSLALENSASPSLRLAVDVAGKQALVLDGEIYEADRVAAALAERGGKLPPNVGADAHAAVLLAGCRAEGPAFLRRIHGSFAAAWWDGVAGRLTLMTDRFGTRPVYYRVASPAEGIGELQFASGLGALVEPGWPLKVNPRGLAEFFTFGHYLRDDTAIAGIRVLPAAAWCEMTVSSTGWRPGTYWSLGEALAGPRAATDEELRERIEAALVASVQRMTRDAAGLGISLSGGLDARTILGLIDTSHTPLTAVCLGMPGSLDHRASVQLAQRTGCRLHLCMLDAQFLGRFEEYLHKMIALTDGQYLSQCIVLPTLPVYRELGIRALLRGHAGELLHLTKAYNYSLDREALQIETDEQLRIWLLSRLKAYMLEGIRRPLFRGELNASLEALAAEAMDEDLAEVAPLGAPRDRISLLFLMQRVRRETTMSLRKFRWVVEPRLPYLDPEVIGAVLAAPLEMRLDEALQTWVLRRRRPALVGVVNSNTGAPLGAGRWRRRWAGLWMRGMAKLGVRGYQPYERLGLWLRRELAPLVQQILLDPQTLDRGLYDPEGVRAVVRGHLEQGRNHTFLLMALMIFELGLRRLAQVASRTSRPCGLRDDAPLPAAATNPLGVE